MAVLDERVSRRREIFDWYKKNLNSSAFSFQPEMKEVKSNRWLTTILLNTNTIKPEQLRLELEKKNIEARPLWKPMHLQPVFKNAPSYLNGLSESLFERGLCLPSGSNLSREDLEFIGSSIKSIIG
jgi:dTDP-4-amino-4,6-dideoxygalactose transaminase